MTSEELLDDNYKTNSVTLSPWLHERVLQCTTLTPSNYQEKPPGMGALFVPPLFSASHLNRLIVRLPFTVSCLEPFVDAVRE